MPADPTYPEDASVSDPAPRNEALEAAVTAKEAAERAKKPRSNRVSFARGAAIGVGSAALVAALLYANASRSKKDKG